MKKRGTGEVWLPAMPTELSAAAPDGARLAITVHRGDGGPRLLMIPGLGSSRRVYDHLIPLLTPRLVVAVFDPRGVGESDVAPGPYTMEQLAADAVAVLDAIGWEKAAVWGASMGGMVAQHVALDHADRVSRLLLACTGPGGLHAVRSDPAATRALLGKGAHTPEEAYRMACTVLYEPEWAEAHRDFVEEQIAYRRDHPVPAKAFSAQYEAVRHHAVYDRLPAVTIPTLVMHGVDDAVMPVGNGELLARRIPGARGVWLPRRGHLFFHEDPETSADAVAGFTAAAAMQPS